jgi:hypothetical protein
VDIIYYLGNILANRINISPTASRGLIKLSIKDELDPFIKFELMKFEDLKNAINNSLRLRLTKLNVQGLEDIIGILLKELTDNQSLITMANV